MPPGTALSDRDHHRMLHTHVGILPTDRSTELDAGDIWKEDPCTLVHFGVQSMFIV